MSRQILCRKCATPTQVLLTADEIASGFRARQVYLSLAKPPASHGYTIEGEFHQLKDFHCDLCNDVVTNQIVIARTVEPPDKEIPAWEHLVGNVLPDDAVKLYDGVINS